MTSQEELGAQIKAAREKAGVTQEDLASKISVSRPQLSNYEHGKSSVPASVIVEIAEALNVEFTIRGSHIAPNGREKAPAPTHVDAVQLCLELDIEHEFPDSILKIRPTRESIHLTALLPRRRQS